MTIRHTLQSAVLAAMIAAAAPAAAAWDADSSSRARAATVDGSVEEGRQMAETLCARCHAVGTEGESPLADAPPFRTFARLWPVSYLEEALAEGIMVGHPVAQMPVFQFTPDEVSHLIRYLESVQEPVPEEEEG